MPLILPRSVMLLIPRTASTWCRQAIRNAGIRFKDLNPKHATSVPQQNPPLPYVPNFFFTIAREPQSWLRSRWVLGPWEDELTKYWRPEFEAFKASVSDGMVDMYFGKYTSKCQFVGKGDNVADDLVAALRAAGEEFSEIELRNTPRVNESPVNGDLIDSAYWSVKLDELAKFPPTMLAKAPIELLAKMPESVLEKMPANVLASVVKSTTRAALQSAGAMTDKR